MDAGSPRRDGTPAACGGMEHRRPAEEWNAGTCGAMERRQPAGTDAERRRTPPLSIVAILQR